MKKLNKPAIDKGLILSNNPKIDKALVTKFTDLENQLLKIGVEIKPKFSLEPPLGNTNIRLCNS